MTTEEAPLTFIAVSAANVARARRWHPDFDDDEHPRWTGADWSNAMFAPAYAQAALDLDAGKLLGGRGELLNKLADEIGDVFLYLDLLAQFYGLDIDRCIADTFNRVSVREGFPERLEVGA